MERHHLKGAAAVIDKDFASELLAEQLNADMLIILTAVEKVAVNFNKPDQKWLDSLTPEEARAYMAEGQFAPGSMLPKVEAAVKFAESRAGPHRPHHPAGKGPGRHRRQNRHPDCRRNAHSDPLIRKPPPSLFPAGGFCTE